jgi:ribosomal protein S18 acetylase RimI-like enzyme
VVARIATRADVPQLIDLMREFYAESAYPLDRDWAERALAHLIDGPVYGAVWIIEDTGVPIGHVVLAVRLAMEFGGLIGYIDDLFVRPGHRRKGAAQAGLDALFAECRRRGCRSVLVEVGPDNDAANAVYRRNGLLPGDDVRQTLRLVLAH